MKAIVHGTPNAYGNRGCRCPSCRAAQSEYVRALQTRPCRSCGAPVYVHGVRLRAAWEERDHRCGRCFRADELPPISHGTETGYRTHACRCAACTEATRIAKARRRGERPELYREIDRRSKRRQRGA